MLTLPRGNRQAGENASARDLERLLLPRRLVGSLPKVRHLAGKEWGNACVVGDRSSGGRMRSSGSERCW